jgi:chorismate mutase/prephenate dehydrogenase
MTDADNLSGLRQQIREIDEQILNLTARRMELARQVGEYKKQHSLPVKDYKVEKTIFEKAKEAAKRLGIYQDLAESLLRTLIAYSVVEQDEIKQKPSLTEKTADAKKVLVVGGLGRMGQWFCQFFDALGHDVLIYDPSGQAASDSPFDQASEWEEAAHSADFVFLATPMAITEQYLQALASLPIAGTIIEISSLKSPIENGLQAARQAGRKVVSLHPMFGPDIELLAGRNILFCDRAGDEAIIQPVKDIFALTSANLIHLPFDQHDRLMSFVLGAAHLVNLIYAGVMKDSGLELSALENIAGTTFAKQLHVTRTVVLENQDLYFDIQSYNRETRRLFQCLEANMEKFRDAILNNRRDDFKAIMDASRTYFSTSQNDSPMTHPEADQA